MAYVVSNLMSRDDITPLFAFFPVPRPSEILVCTCPGSPHVRRLDFRAEWVATNPPNNPLVVTANLPIMTTSIVTCINKNNLIWGLGRQRGARRAGLDNVLVQSTNFTPTRLPGRPGGERLIPGGGTINDGSVKLNDQVGRALTLSAYVQCEQWAFPLLAPQPKTT